MYAEVGWAEGAEGRMFGMGCAGGVRDDWCGAVVCEFFVGVGGVDAFEEGNGWDGGSWAAWADERCVSVSMLCWGWMMANLC